MTEKNIYISYLRVIATVFVILIHASTGFLNNFNPDSFNWNYANIINSFTRCAVPIFVMLSGALLLPKSEETLVFYKKRVTKLLLPFGFWTIIYTIYYFYKYTKFERLSQSQILEIIQDKVLHGANAHLWYLYMILGIYLAIPYLQKLLKQLSIKEIEYFLIIWGISMIIMNKRFYSNVPKFDLTFFSGYIGYLILGYYLSVKDFRSNKFIHLLIYIIGGIITAIGTYLLSAEVKKYDPMFYYYLFPTTAFCAFFLFTTAKKYFSKKTNLPKWIQVIDQYSFGIYLVHIIPLNYLHPLFSKYMSTMFVIPLVTIATTIASICIIYLFRKIPYGKYISG